MRAETINSRSINHIPSSLISSLSGCRIRAYAVYTLEMLIQSVLIVSLIYVLVTIVVSVVFGMSPKLTLSISLLALIIIIAWTFIRVTRYTFSLLDAANIADSRLDLKEVISNALELSLLQECATHPFLAIAIEEANRVTSSIHPNIIIPIRWPTRTAWALAALMVSCAITFLPYSYSYSRHGSVESDSAIAREGYRLLEESRRVEANAQSMGDAKLQRIGEQLRNAARKMTEQITSERQIERNLQAISKQLDDLARNEFVQSQKITDASQTLEDAYSRLDAAGRSSPNAAQALNDAKSAMSEASEATGDKGLATNLAQASEKPSKALSDSEILDAMQRLQEESAQAQSRQQALNQAADALSQSMTSLGFEKKNGSQKGSSSLTKEASDSLGDSGEGAESGSQGQDGETPTQEGKGGSSKGTEGSHIETLGATGERPLEGAGSMEKLTGTVGQGKASSTAVVVSGNLSQDSADGPGEGTDGRAFGGESRASEEMVVHERVPSTYKRIVADYFKR